MSETIVHNSSGISPLARCVLLDSRPSIREELRVLIRSIDLFQETAEVVNLGDALRLIESVQIDAFIIGPSMTVDGCKEFARRARDGGASADCAYIKLIRERDSSEEALDGELIHEAVSWPCTRAALSEAAVRAVLKAAANSPWPGIKLGDGNQILVCADGQWKVTTGKELVALDSPLFTRSGGRDLLDDPDSDPLEEVALEREEEINSLLNNAIGDTQTVDLLMVLIRQMSRKAAKPLNSEHFQRFIMGALEEWQLEAEFGSSKTAITEFRRRLSYYHHEFLS